MQKNKFSKAISIIQKKISAKVWPKKSIVFYASATPNQWTPNSLRTGIGGAEGRIIHLSREWVKLGYQVTVFNNCGAQAGIYDGVEYQQYDQFNPNDTFDTLIVWHFAWRLKFPVQANRVWLDLGKGVLLPHEAAYEKLKYYDLIFCKNPFHRSTLPEIPDEKIRIIPNGIDLEFKALKDTSKQLHKIIYASNYARGLEKMLEYGWPIVRRAVPEAELHIFYGWGRDLKPEWKARMQQLLSQPGIFEHGKVGRQQLMQEKATSTLHYYGCTFAEIDCNTVRESALVGCVPVTTCYGGLIDKDYCVKVEGNPFQPETQVALAEKVAELLLQPDRVAQCREQFSKRVQMETWENVAKEWLRQI